MTVEYKNHLFEVDYRLTRRYRLSRGRHFSDDYVLKCSRCMKAVKVRTPLNEKVARLSLDPCPEETDE